MTKHILVATDLSPRSDRAVRRAADLARSHNARLTLIHVLDDAMPDDLLVHAQTRSTEHLERFAASVAGDLTYTTLPCVGDPTETLLDMVQDQDPSLLVVGVHRPRSILGELRETTAQRVVRLSSCPVLIVREPDDHPYRAVLAATDFSPAATAALNLGHMLAPTASVTPIHLMHIPYQGLAGYSDEANAALQASFLHDATAADADWRAKHALPVTIGHTEFAQGGPWITLKTAADRHRADLITVGAHGRAGAHRALLGSLATDLMRDPPCDVLIARP